MRKLSNRKTRGEGVVLELETKNRGYQIVDVHGRGRFSIGEVADIQDRKR